MKKTKKIKKNYEDNVEKRLLVAGAAFNKNAIRAHARGHPRCIIYDFYDMFIVIWSCCKI